MSRAQYTLHLDADSLVLNMSRSLEPFLQTNASVLLQVILHLPILYCFNSSLQSFFRNQFHLHLIISPQFQMRENYEITSAIYIVRNDHRGFCFLDYWRRLDSCLVNYTPYHSELWDHMFFKLLCEGFMLRELPRSKVTLSFPVSPIITPLANLIIPYFSLYQFQTTAMVRWWQLCCIWLSLVRASHP